MMLIEILVNRTSWAKGSPDTDPPCRTRPSGRGWPLTGVEIWLKPSFVESFVEVSFSDSSMSISVTKIDGDLRWWPVVFNGVVWIGEILSNRGDWIWSIVSNRDNWVGTIVIAAVVESTCSQFHQHYTYEFFVRTCFL